MSHHCYWMKVRQRNGADVDAVLSLWVSVRRMSSRCCWMGLQSRRRSWSESIWRGRASRPAGMSLRRRWRRSSAPPSRPLREPGGHRQQVNLSWMFVSLSQTSLWRLSWRLCIYFPAETSGSRGGVAGGGGGGGGGVPALPNSRMYDEIYFDSDSEEEDTPSKHECVYCHINMSPSWTEL